MTRSRSVAPLAGCVLATLAFAETAGACLMAERLRIVAPHLSEEEIQAIAHDHMHPELIPYHLEAAAPCVGGTADIFQCDNVDLLGFVSPAELGSTGGNDLWGWQDPLTGTEYALMGLRNGVAFIDLSDPENPLFVGKLPTHIGTGSSAWRDVKVFADHAFVVSDFNQSHGMQVFDLTQLRDVVSPPVTFAETAYFNGPVGMRLDNAHNIEINEDTGFAYAVGSDGWSACNEGLYMIDVNTPTSPQLAGCYAGDGYTHDVQCVLYHGPDLQHVGKEICFASNEDTVTIVDVTNKQNPIQLSETGYADHGYTHQGWLTEDHRYFVHDDELDEREAAQAGNPHNTRTYTWDVADLDAPQLNGFWDAAGSAVDHNQYIKGNYTYQANYKRGLRILALVDPSTGTMEEVAFFDTYPGGGDPLGFDGAWSTYPFFDSGIVLVSDISRGLFILRPRLPEIFEDGFESGDTSAWSVQVPLF